MLPHSYDLHMHSTASDGAFSPLALLQAAHEAGVRVLAITDHDTFDAHRALAHAELPSGMRLINGAEFTCRHEKHVLHIVGLGFELSEAMQAHFASLDQLRSSRAQLIAERLVKAGLPDLLLKAQALAGDGQIGRPHFAQAMVEESLVKDQQQAFDRYLGRGKVGDVKVDWPGLEEVLALIKMSGGVSVLAHPTKYNLTLSKLRYLIADFAELGGEAVEIGYPGITADQQNSLARILLKHGLKASAGSDFHAPQQHWSRLGSFPTPPASIPHVLDIFAEKAEVIQ